MVAIDRSLYTGVTIGMMPMKSKLWLRAGLVASTLIALAVALVLFIPRPSLLAPSSTSTATSQPANRLAQPPLPEKPTQYEWGRYLYWLNCMACHGDQGQGLTVEFRSLYVEDQNCWGRGCHAGHPGDKGFPIPRTVPAIISSTGTLPPFADADALFEFLRSTHPPQHPGALPDDQYWALSDYLFIQNHRLPPGRVIGPAAEEHGALETWRIVAAGSLFVVAGGIVVFLLTRRKRRNSLRSGG